jgi:uncharacterized coiled-coil DUF342 family protein
MAHAWWRDVDYELFYRLTRERDEARSQMRELAEVAARNVNDASHLRRTACELERERDEARAEVERLRADNADLLACLDAAAFAVPQGLRDVAEAQREACAKYAFCQACANEVSGAPLVTEGDK